MPKALTDSVVKTLKPERGATAWREVFDGGCRGLRLRISPTGEKAWVVRVMVNGTRIRQTLGAYPAVSLEEARRRAREYVSGARDGASPEEMDARKEAGTMTVTTAHKKYVEAVKIGLRDTTISLKESMFSAHIEPVVGRRLIRTIRRADVVEVVGSVTAKGFTVQANRVYSEFMALLRWCEQKGWLDGVPTVRKKEMRSHGAAKEKARRRTLAEAEIKQVWRIAADLGDLTRDFLRLLLLTGQRRDEVRLMRWEELDLANAKWAIPGERYKIGADHAVPLSKPVLDILNARWREGAKGYVLVGRKADQAFNGAASSLRRLREEVTGNGDFTLHDIRRTVRTGLSRLGVDETTAELVIGHVPQGMVKTYDVYDRWEERRVALDRWSEYVKAVADQRDNVVPMTRAPEIANG